MRPKLLLLDIETAPAKAYVWRMHDENISLDQLIEPGRIICWGAKWLGERKVYYADERSGVRPMFRQIHKLMSEADALVTYNGQSFDLPKLDGAFVEYELGPVPPVAHLDLYQTVKRLGYQSGKLAFVGPYLRIGAKVKHEGFSLWRSCLDGDRKAWARMKKYNLQDVRLLDGLYKRIRPYIKNHPYLAATTGKCPACQSDNAESRGNRRTKTLVIQRLRCNSCGLWYDGNRQRMR